MGRLVLYIMEWAFALIILLTIYKAVFSGTTFYRFNRFYLLGATVLSALLPLVHITIPEKTPMVSGMAISDTEFAQELSGTFSLMNEPQLEIMEPAQSDNGSRLWAVILVCMYSGYVLMLMIGWIRSIIRARRFLRGKPRRRISRTVWLVTHDEEFGPFSWMNYIVISDTENGFARRASLRHEYSHVKLLHSVDLVFLLACTIFNPVCWLVLQEIKIVHEYEADHEVISHHGIRNGDYQKLLIMRTVGAEAYALASSFNLNIKKRINMLNKNQTRKRRLMWLLILIPALGIISVLFARSEKSHEYESVQEKEEDSDFTVVPQSVGNTANFSQNTNLSKMDSDKRNEYLTSLAKEVTKQFGPEFYRDTINPVISDIMTFNKGNSKQQDIIKNDGRKYYTVTFPTTEKLEWYFTSKVDIWEDDGQPKGVLFGTGIGPHFMSKSYNEWLKEGIKEEDKFPYQTAVPILPIPAFDN